MKLKVLVATAILALIWFPTFVTALEFRPVDIRSTGRRTAGGGSRGNSVLQGQSLTALIPDTNIGLTVSKYPTFFMYVPATSLQTGEFILVDEDENIVYETTFTLPSTDGIVSISLPATGTIAPLEIGKKYHWYFGIISAPNDRASDISVEGWVQRVEPSSSLIGQLEKATPNERPALYAASGIWHETLTSLAELRRSNPDDATPINQWKELLKSVGLDTISEKNLLESLPLLDESRVQPPGTVETPLQPERAADQREGSATNTPNVRQTGGYRPPDIRSNTRQSEGSGTR